MSCCRCHSSTTKSSPISALILDLDGTLLDTERATEGILKSFLQKYGKVLDREKEESRVGMMFKDIAASVLEDYGLPLTVDDYIKEITPCYKERWPQVKALPGANRLIRHMHKHGIPFALASNSARENIEAKITYHQGWTESFSVILGGNEVKSGKPSPDIFLEAARRMGADPSRCLVIEDSLVGLTAAKAAGMKVVAVPSLKTLVHRYSTADSVLTSLLEFRPELWGLPPFEDWVHDGLPIEPLQVKGIVSRENPLQEHIFLDMIADSGSYVSPPDQVSGVFFGWARNYASHDMHKVVVAIGQELQKSSRLLKRVIRLCFVGESRSNLQGEALELFIVGYIRPLDGKVSLSEEFYLSGEDTRIADASLDLPMFNHVLENSSRDP